MPLCRPFAVRATPLTGALLVACALLTACGSGPEPAGRATVTHVTDGDTIRLSGLGRVRLIGVDTPEVYGRTECFGPQASRFVRALVPPGTTVRYRLGAEERDRYGRALAYVWLSDGRSLNRLLVIRGYAQPLAIAPNVYYADRFEAAARRARRAGRGLWGRRGCAAGRGPLSGPGPARSGG
jgi:micrococcal nuclease